MSDWNWSGEEEKRTIVVAPVEAVAVYENEAGQIVIRQQDAMQEQDSVIVVPKSSVKALIKALQATLKG